MIAYLFWSSTKTINFFGCSWLCNTKSVKSIRNAFFVQRVMVCNQQLLPCKLRAFTDPAIVLSMFMLQFIFVIACDLFEWKQICRFLSICLYMYCCWRFSYQERWVGIPLTGLTLSLTWTWISNIIWHGLCWVQWEVIVCFVDIGGIVLIFLFIT